MATPAGNEIAVRVRIDGTAAIKDAEKTSGDISKALKKGMLGFGAAAAGTFGLFYGGITKQAIGAIAGYGDILGRGTQFGQQFANFAGKLGAKSTAAEQTAEAFGLAGKNATREQVLSVYNMFKGIEELRQSSRNNVYSAIGIEEKAEATEQFKSAVEKFKASAADFGDMLKKWGYGIKFGN